MTQMVVLDSCVLYPLPLRDTLLRAAERELFDPVWSRRILSEVIRNLIADRRATDQQANRMVAAMDAAFDSAAVADPAIRGASSVSWSSRTARRSGRCGSRGRAHTG